MEGEYKITFPKPSPKTKEEFNEHQDKLDTLHSAIWKERQRAYHVWQEHKKSIEGDS